MLVISHTYLVEEENFLEVVKDQSDLVIGLARLG